MQRVYLALAIIGYLLTGMPMLMESARCGNILLFGLGGTLPVFLCFRERRLGPAG